MCKLIAEEIVKNFEQEEWVRCHNHYGETQQKQLFKIGLQNLTVEPENSVNPEYHLNMTYSSKDGLIYLAFGGEKYKLLNLLTTTTSGKEIISFLEINKLQLPGKLINSKINYENFSIELIFTNLILVDNYEHNTKEDYDEDGNKDDYKKDHTMDIQIHSSARTTII